jgi:PAS domain S-box-containing protein
MITLRTGEPQRDVIMSINRPDGSRVWIEVNSEPIHDPASDAVTGVVASFADITQRKLAQMKLAASERKWHAIFDQTYQFIGLLDAQGVLLEVNRTALKFVEASEAEVLGKPFADTRWWVHDPAQQARLREAIEHARRGELVRFETTHRAADGSLHYADFSLKPVVGEQGQLVWLVAEGRDITERRREEENLLEIARGVSAQTGLRFFESLVQHLANVLQADFAFIGELMPGTAKLMEHIAVI